MNQSAGMAAEHIRNPVLDIVLTLITVGIFNLFVQNFQMKAVNEMIREEKYSFWPWLGLTIITCGLYHIYHEYRKSSDIARANGKQDGSDVVIVLVLTIFGLSIVADAIQQSEINRFYGSGAL